MKKFRPQGISERASGTPEVPRQNFKNHVSKDIRTEKWKEPRSLMIKDLWHMHNVTCVFLLLTQRTPGLTSLWVQLRSQEHLHQNFNGSKSLTLTQNFNALKVFPRYVKVMVMVSFTHKLRNKYSCSLHDLPIWGQPANLLNYTLPSPQNLDLVKVFSIVCIPS